MLDMTVLVRTLLVASVCVWQTQSIEVKVNDTHKPHHHVAVHKVNPASVPHMLNHGSATHKSAQTHVHKQARMLNDPKTKHAAHVKEAASKSLPITSAEEADELEDTMFNFVWTQDASTGPEIWLPNVGHNTRIFRAELCSDRKLDSKHYDDCWAFMTKFCARNDNLWAALSAAWEATVQGFCDKFWKINDEQVEEEVAYTTELTTTQRPSTRPFHETVFEPVHKAIFSPTTTRAPPVRQPVHIVEPEPTETAITDICANERRLGRKADRHCHEYMDKECDARRMHRHGRHMSKDITDNCHDFYVMEEEKMYKSTDMSPAPGPGPSAYVWPPVDNQKKEEWDMPEQGFSGGPVSYDNGKKMTGDWQREFGPKAGGYQTVRAICMNHPDNEWCRLSGYHKPLRAAAVNDNAWVEPPKSSTQQLLIALALVALALVIAVVLRKSSGG